MESLPIDSRTSGIAHDPEFNPISPLAEQRTLVLEVASLEMTFDRPVLRQISFQVFQGETFVILGGSGCGKSTLLNILIGVLPPTAGSARIFGENLFSLDKRALKKIHLRCGVLFQSGALLESLTLVENIFLPLRQHYQDTPSDILLETARLKLRMVGLNGHEQKFPSDISGGMRKRAALARALALDPELVFADEPTSGLDPVTTQEIDELFIRLTRRIGAAAVVVTHDIGSFYRIADRAMMLGGEKDGNRKGQILVLGDQEVFRCSADPLVRRFLDGGLPRTRETGSPTSL